MRYWMCLVIVGLSMNACTIRRVSFDNRTTSEEYLWGAWTRDGSRDVDVHADFVTADRTVSNVALSLGLDFAGAAQVVRAGRAVEQARREKASAATQLVELSARRDALSRIDNAMLALDDARSPELGPHGLRSATSADDLEARLKALQDDIVARWKTTGLTKSTSLVTGLFDELRETDQWKALKTAYAGTDSQAKQDALGSFAKVTNEKVLALRASIESADKLKSRIEDLEKQVAGADARLVAGEAKLRETIQEPEKRQQLFELLKETESEPQASAAVAAPQQAQAAALKEAADEKKKEVDKAEGDLKTLQALDLPPVAKVAAVNAQRQLVEDVRGKYQEALQEYLSVASDVQAVTDYHGPGEKSVVYTITFFGPGETIERYPNGMIKRVGPPVHEKSLGNKIVEETGRVLRVLAIPAAFVAALVVGA